MYKKLMIFLLLFLCGCSKVEKDIKTFIEENDTYLISINYPITNIKKLDDLITNYTNKIYKDFKNNISDNDKRDELNIDYKFSIVDDRYYNIVLKTYINDNELSNDLYTICYDKLDSKILDIYDIINSKTNKITNINKNTPFFFDNDNLIVYKKDKSNTFPLNDLDLLINIKKNETSKAKEANVKVFKNIDPNRPVLALTFDDGPSKYTKKILNLLKENEAFATFFILGNKAKIFDETLNLIIQNGNEIGNHSYNHKLLTNLSDLEIKSQIEDTQNIVYDTTGFRPLLLRPTYGSVNKNIRNNTDLTIVLWNVDTLDWKIKNSKKIANRLVGSAKDLDIILMHDTYERTFKALSLAIPKLKEKGFQFVTVSELLEIKNYREKIKDE